jgi:hypothetical protein
MAKLSRNRGSGILCVILSILFIWFFCFNEVVFAQTTAPPTAKIFHTALNYFIPGFRIKIRTGVADSAGIMLARCYFRSKEGSQFVFVDMLPTTSNEYEGILPAPLPATQTIEYIILVVNFNKVVIRSQTFSVSKAEASEPPEWQKADLSGQIFVYDELASDQQTIPGFSDKITINAVDSPLRFGLICEGIYSPSQAQGLVIENAAYGGVVVASPMANQENAVAPKLAGSSAQSQQTMSEYLAGKLDGEKDAKGSPFWILGGLSGVLCLCIGFVGIGAAYLLAPNPPTTALLGKPTEYVLGYTDGYKSKARLKNTLYATVGCTVAAVINLVIGLATTPTTNYNIY